MFIRRRSVDASIDPSGQLTIPMTNYQVGSWQVAISRRPRAKEDLARRYDAASRKWHHITRRYRLVSAYRRSLIASGAIAALEDVGSQAEVLDCGIGSGALSIALNSILSTPPKIHGIDLSSKMLARAAAEMRLAGLAPELRQADILTMPFADASFDAAMAAHVIEHLPDPQLALKEMVRVLKPGGMFFLCTVRRSGFGALIQMRWRTWAISELQGISWLRTCNLDDVGFQPVNLGAFAGQASTAFWARRPKEPTHFPEIDTSTKNPEDRPMRTLRKSEWAILVFVIAFSFLPTFGALFRVLELAGGPAIMSANPRATAMPVPIVLHILSSFLFLILGALQFLPSIRQRHPAAHRTFGRVVAVAGCLSAGSGLWMTYVYSFPISLQGSLLYWVRITLGLLMFGFIVWAVLAIRSSNVFQHSALMLRAYAIGQGASTQALIGIGWIILVGTEATGPLRDVQMVSAWAINLLIAEVLIWKTLAPMQRMAAHAFEKTLRVGH